MTTDEMLTDEVVRVYYEEKTSRIHVATFDSEYLYDLCLPALEKDCASKGWERVSKELTQGRA